MALTYDHLHFRTADVDATAKYYQDNFGATLVESRPDRSKIIDIAGLRCLISFLQPGMPPLDTTSVGGRSLDHFAFRVPNLDEEVARMKAKGVVFASEPITAPSGVKYVFVIAPDNVRVEILERA